VAHESVIFVLSELGIIGGLIFLLLNFTVFAKVASMTLSRSLNGQLDWRLFWTNGPACWLFFGLIGGFTFNLSFALVWIGIFHAMLALASSTIRPAQEPPAQTRSRSGLAAFDEHEQAQSRELAN
jgi:hypothetical protein